MIAIERSYLLRLIITGQAFVCVYATTYLLLGAWFSAALQFSSVLILTPLVLLLDKKNYTAASRLLFIFSGMLAIVATPFGIQAPLNAEYYFIPVIMGSLLMFDLQQRSAAVAGVILQLATWGLLLTGYLPTLPADWLPQNFPAATFRIINTIGAVAIAAIFIYHYRRHVQRLTADSIEKLTAVNRHLEFVQSGAALGVWEWWIGENRVAYDQRWCEMLGLIYESTTQTIETWQELVHPEDLERVLADIKRHLNGETAIFENIHRLRHADGRWLWILDRGRISARDSSGLPLRFTGIHLDITKTKELENLANNVQKLALIGGWELDAETKVASWSEETARIHGFSTSRKEKLAEAINFYPPPDREILDSRLQMCLDLGKPFDEELNFVDINGTQKWLRVVGEAVKDNTGHVRKLFGIVQDISARRQSEIALEASRTELDQFFSISLDLLCVADQSGYLRRVNPAFTEVLGFSPEELMAQPFMELVHPADVDFSRAQFAKLATGVPTIRLENRFRAKSGAYRVFSWSISPDKETGILYCSVRDVTDQRRAELELQQTLAAINLCASVAISDEKGRFLEVNDNFCRISGYRRDELIGQTYALLNSGTHDRELFSKLWLTISSGKIWTGEIQNRRKDGEFFWVQTVISPLCDQSGQIRQYVAFHFDVSERKLTERKLIRSAQMETLGEMAGGIAHEINNPLTIIFGKSNQLRRQLVAGQMEIEKMENGLRVIETTANRIAKIVKGLRAFSRNTEGDPKQATPIKSVIDDALELCRERFENNAIDLRISCDIEAQILCRSAEICQVLMNLLNNAFDAVVDLSEKWISLEVSRSDQGLSIVVTDSGAGIPAEIAEKMMQPFYTTKEVGKGTGLGLSISKGIAEEHGGRLSLDRSSAHTRFCFELPVVSDQTKEAVA